MMDLIERQAAIDAIDETNWYHQNENKDMVNGANSAEHQPWFKSDDVYAALKSVPDALRWIPCKERLPELYTPVLISTVEEDCDSVECGMTRDKGIIHRKPEWITVDGFPVEVTAWMPLPEPWKGENND